MDIFGNSISEQRFFWLREFGMLLFVIIAGMLVGTLINQTIIFLFHVDMNMINFDYLDDSSKVRLAWFYRLILVINHLFVFIYPALLFLIIRKFKLPTHFNDPSLLHMKTIFPAIMILIMSYPLVSYASVVNGSIHLPAVFETMEEQSVQVMKLLLADHNILALVANLIVIAVIPAIGEELLFRGCLQTVMIHWLKKPELAIWVTAIIFSAMHMQFEGFLPRFILGLVLGYLFYWSGNILYPIIVHMFNNAFQIILQYIFVKDIDQMGNLEEMPIPFPIVLLSVAGLMMTTWWFRNQISKAEG